MLMTATLLIVDDYQLVRYGLQAMLKDNSFFKIIGEAANGQEAVTKARELKPDIILLDVHLPDQTGLEVTQQILTFLPAVKILALTSFPNESLSLQMLETGAMGYITKDTNTEELGVALVTILSGQRYLNAPLAHNLASRNTAVLGRHKDAQSPFEKLSKQERAVLELLLQGLKTNAIAEKLKNNAKTVNSYRYRVFAKLGVKNDNELILLALQYQLL